jgi:hypothetical protein
MSSFIHEDYPEDSLWSAVNKTTNVEKILLYTENAYTLKLLLNIVTAGTEAIVVSGNKFSCPGRSNLTPMNSATLCHLITVAELLSQPVLQGGKRALVARSEIRDGRRVGKQS